MTAEGGWVVTFISINKCVIIIIGIKNGTWLIYKQNQYLNYRISSNMYTCNQNNSFLGLQSTLNIANKNYSHYVPQCENEFQTTINHMIKMRLALLN